MKRKLFLALTLTGVLALSPLIGGCGSSSDAADPPGGKRIVLNGGAGTGGAQGGGGGGLLVDSYASVSFRSSGSVDASFTLSDYGFAFDPGTNGATVGTNTAVVLLKAGDPEPAAGTLYVTPGTGPARRLYRSEGDGVPALDNDVVTGLRIAPGATLTIPANTDTNSLGILDTVGFTLANDLVVEGTLKSGSLNDNTLGAFPQRHGADATARDKAGVAIAAGRIRIAQGGSVVTSGDPGATAGARGGDAGFVHLTGGTVLVNGGSILASGGSGSGAIGGNGAVSYDGSDIDSVNLASNGNIVNTGAIATTGGSGTSGGWGGKIEFGSATNVANTGALDAGGGSATTGGGGNGGNFNIYSLHGSISNSGALNSRGGDGGAGGGNGGNLRFYSNDTAAADGFTGKILNSGNVQLSGGNATVSGPGGGAGGIDFFACGRIANSGSLVSSGGNAKGAGAFGGNGGQLYVESYYGYTDNGFTYRNAPGTAGYGTAAGPIGFSADIALAGGGADGADGRSGNGGQIEVYTYPHRLGLTPVVNANAIPPVLPVEFVGYGAITLNGGSGVGYIFDQESFGNGGVLEIYTHAAQTLNGIELPIPPIANDVPVELRGGDATGASTYGGSGGRFTLATMTHFMEENPGTNNFAAIDGGLGTLAIASNAGRIDARGGNSSGSGGFGGFGGEIVLFGYNRVVNTGTFDGSGGDATGPGGTGGESCGPYKIDSAGDIVNRGAILLNGGNGLGTNGSGGNADGTLSNIRLYLTAGGLVDSTGTLSARGGNATGTGTNGRGGNITLYSQNGPSVFGTLDVGKGSGGSGGRNGTTTIDVWVPPPPPPA
jgi:hypothetical protein